MPQISPHWIPIIGKMSKTIYELAQTIDKIDVNNAKISYDAQKEGLLNASKVIDDFDKKKRS